VILRLAVLCDRRTDGWETHRQTHDDSIYRASIASRGNKPPLKGAWSRRSNQ